MKHKSDKVEEPTAPYATKKVAEQPAASPSEVKDVKRADDAAFEKAMNKVFSERKELLHKLAQ